MSQECCAADDCRSQTPSMTGAEGIDDAVAVLRALADPVRLRLFVRIAAAADEICVCDLDDVGVSQPTVSHHLRRLREAGLIACRRRGTWVYYRITGAGGTARAALEVLHGAGRPTMV